MKSLLSVLVVLTLFIPSISAFAYENEPDGFNNIKWGTNIKDLPSMVPKQVRSDPMSPMKYKVYEMKDDEPFLGQFDLETPLYMFYGDRLFGVVINITRGKKIFDNLKETMVNKHGKAKTISKKPFERYEWFGEVLITMVWLSKRNYGYLGYTYMPIREEMVKVQNKGN